MSTKKKRGFASLSPERQRELASMGGKAAHAKGTAHTFTFAEAQAAGRKGAKAKRRKLAGATIHALVCWLLASTAFAQTTIAPSRLTVMVLPLTGDPMTVAPIAISIVLMNPAGASWCNLAPVNALPPPYLNPKVARVTDPFQTGRDCEVPIPTTLTSGGVIPTGDYRLEASYGSDTCIVPPSTIPQPCEGQRTGTPIPFTVALSAKPAAPTGLKVIK